MAIVLTAREKAPRPKRRGDWFVCPNCGRLHQVRSIRVLAFRCAGKTHLVQRQGLAPRMSATVEAEPNV